MRPPRHRLSFALMAGLALNLYGAATTGSAADLPRNEYIYAGGSIACIFHSTAGTPPGPDEGMLACLHMGPLKIGTAVAEMERHLGPPVKTLEKDGLEYRVYLNPGSTDSNGYYVIGYLSGLTKVIQQTADPGEKSFSFSSINLGDSSQRVRNRLGPPNRTSPIPEVDGILWDYSPFPFTFEIKSDHVFSIRIYDPRDASQ